MSDFAASDGSYVSTRWCIAGGTRGSNERLWDKIKIIAVDASGSVDGYLDLLAEKGLYVDGPRITDLCRATAEEIVRQRTAAAKTVDDAEVNRLYQLEDGLRKEFPNDFPMPFCEQVKERTDGLYRPRPRRAWAVLREGISELPKPGYQPGRADDRRAPLVSTAPPLQRIKKEAMREQEPENSGPDAPEGPIAIPAELVYAYVESQGTPRDHPDFEGHCRNAWLDLSRRYGAVGPPSAIRAMSEQRTEWEKAQAAPSEILFEMAEAYLKSVQSEPPSQPPTEGAAGESVPKSARSASQVSEHSVHATTAVLASLCADLPTPRERGAGSVFAVDYARDHPNPLLRPINDVRLLAMGTLLEEAREAVQRGAPKTPQDAERCLRPAISKYAKEVFDQRAEAKLRDAGPRLRPGAYGRWLRSKCLPVVVDDVCMFDGLSQITVRHVADYIGDEYPRETFHALWGILARELEPNSFRSGAEARLGAELEARSLYWEAKAISIDRTPRARKAKGAAAGVGAAGSEPRTRIPDNHRAKPENSNAAKAKDAILQKTVPSANRGDRTDRQLAVDAYIEEVFREKQRKISRTDLWKSERYKTRTEFERWESGWYERHGKPPNKSAHRKFIRMLKEKPHLK